MKIKESGASVFLEANPHKSMQQLFLSVRGSDGGKTATLLVGFDYLSSSLDTKLLHREIQKFH